MATRKEKLLWKKEAIESFEQAKSFLITNGGKQITTKIMHEVLEIEEFPSESEAIHPVEEEKLLKALFYVHANAVDSIVNTVIRMINDGVLEPNGDKAKEVADKLRADNEEDFNLEEDQDDEE
jgi:hypothetical protein